MPYRTLLLRNPHRRPADWQENLAPPQRAVFLSDVRNGAELNSDGQPVPRSASSCLVFDSMEEATVFCRQIVERLEHVQCDIYDQRGSAFGPIGRFVGAPYLRRQPNRRTAYWLIVAGCLLIPLCPLFLYLDWLHSGGLVIPTLLGLNCVFLALRLFYMAHATLKAAKSVSDPTQ